MQTIPKPGKRYWFYTGYVIRSGLFTGEMEHSCYILKCRNGDTWMIRNVYESKEAAIKKVGDVKVYDY